MTVAESPPGERGLWDRARGDWRCHMGAIVALALIPRMVYLAQIVHWPFFYFPVLDSRTQYQWGGILVQTFGMGSPEVLSKPPLYAYFLALNQAFLGQGRPSLFSARLIQLALGAVTCGLTYLVGRRVFGTAAGIAAGLLAAAYSPGVFNDGELLDTALASFLAVTFFLLTLRALDDPRPGRWLGCGLVLGLLGLTRGNMLLLVFWALGLLAAGLRRDLGVRGVMRLAGMFVLGLALVILPITGRNFLISGHFVPIAGNGGINFYTGNNPHADGYSPIPAGIEWERTWYAALNAGVFDVTDRYWMGRALKFWRTQPGRAFLLLLKKIVLYWNAYEIPNNVSYEWGRAHASVLRALPLRFGLLSALALLGMVWAMWRGRRARALVAFVLVQMAAVVIFFVCDRYRMTAVPALCALGGFWLVSAGEGTAKAWRNGKAARAALVALGSAAALLLTWAAVERDWYGLKRERRANRDWFYLGQSYQRAQRLPQAKEALLKAVEVHPEDADAYRFLGNIAHQMGDDRAAVEYLRQCLRIAPDYGDAAAALADIALSRNWPVEDILPLVEYAARKQHYNVSVLSELVRLEIKTGDLGQAQKHLFQAADALSHIHPMSSRRPMRETSYRQAAMAAVAAGIPLPRQESLTGPWGPGWNPYQRSAR